MPASPPSAVPQRPAELTAAELLECVSAATRAPSIHNTQPWRFVVATGGPVRIEVHADASRQLRTLDPSGRSMHISCGAAVLNLRLALAAHGVRPHVQLGPDRSDPALVATLTGEGRARVTGEQMRRYDALLRRRTSRSPFADRPVPAEVADRLVAAVAEERAVLRILDGDEGAAVLSLVRTAEGRLRRDAAYRDELARWTGGAQREDGVPPEAYGPWSAMEQVPMRDFALARPVVRSAQRFEAEPTLGLLSTEGDDARSWLRAGMALQRLLVELTAEGLVATPMTQPMDLSDLRHLIAERSALHVPQVIVRMGYGPEGAATPRRPVAAVTDLRAT